MNNTQSFWYVVKQEDGTCEIVEFKQSAKIPEKSSEKSHWGAFKSEQEAISKRVGLIRGGKCKPK